MPEYRGEVFFIEQEMVVQEKQKHIHIPQTLRMTTQMCISWLHTNHIEVHQL